MKNFRNSLEEILLSEGVLPYSYDLDGNKSELSMAELIELCRLILQDEVE